MDMIQLEQALAEKRILIVDDLVEARSSLKKMMSMMGANHIDTATDGNEAMRFIMERDYDIVLSDYNLGKGKDGQQILEEARYSHRLKATSLFILVTGENAIDMVMGALEYEPDAYITKPYTLNILRERMVRILQIKLALEPINEAIDEQQLEQAIALAQQTLVSQPKLRLPLTRILGKLFLRLQRYPEALAAYEALLEQRSVSWARLGQAICMHYLGDSRTAIALLRQTLTLHPLYVQCYDWLAIILQAQGDDKQAQQQLEKAVSISPKAVLRQMDLGRLALKNDDYPVAEAAFEQAVRLGRHSCYKHADNYLNFAKVVQQGLHNDGSKHSRVRSERIFKLVEELRQEYAGKDDIQYATHLLECKTYVRLDNDDKAREAAQRAEQQLTKLKQRTHAQQLQMLDAYLDTQQHVKAKQLIKQLHKDNLSEHDAAQLSAQENRLNQIAIREYTTELNAKGVSYYEQREYEKAIAAFDEAIDYEEAGISVLLNAVQAKLSYMETQNVDVRQLKDCHQLFKRIGTVGSNDERYTRYQRLRDTYARLKRAAGL